MAEAEEQREMNRREFSYDVTAFEKQITLTRWWVMEKGSEQSELTQRYDLSRETINKANEEIYECFPFIKEEFSNEFSESQMYRELDCTVYLKKTYDPVYSAKARGVIYTLLKLPKERRNSGVVTVSTGKFAYILGHYAWLLDIKVTVVMPTTIADEHVRTCKAISVNVVLHGSNMIEAHKYAVNLARNDGLFYLDGHDHPNMIIGQATLGIEISKMSGVDVVILPTIFPDCGLTAGIAKAIKDEKPEIRTIETVPLHYDKFINDIRRQTTLYNKPDFFSTKYQWSKDLQRETLFNDYRPVHGKSIFGAKRSLQRIEGIDDFCTSLGLGWIKTAEPNEKTFIIGKRIVIFSVGEMDSYMNYKLCTKSQPFSPDAGPSTSHPAVPHAGPSTSRQ